MIQASKSRTVAGLALGCALAMPMQASDGGGSFEAAAASGASLRDFSWLVGKWEGRLPDPNLRAEQEWWPAEGGLILGMFRLLRGDRPVLLELFVLRELEDGLEMRLRHFSTALDPMEKGDPIILRLVSLDGKTALFENPVHSRPKTSRITRNGPDSYDGSSEVIADDGSVSRIEASWRRVRSSTSAAGSDEGGGLHKEVVVSAALREVWNAFTTPEGLSTWAAPAARVELRVGGPFELYFRPDEPAGRRGMEGTTILSYLPMRMISYTGVPQCDEVRKRNETPWIVWRFEPVGDRKVRILFSGFGWGEGEECRQARARFDTAMEGIMEKLRSRFSP